MVLDQIPVPKGPLWENNGHGPSGPTRTSIISPKVP